jgi:protein gp37
MGETTGIAWSDSTWNPWAGCTKVSEGCALCYMYTLERRWGRDPEVVRRSKTTFKDPLNWERRVRDGLPLPPDGRFARNLRVFTCSLSDFFHEAADPWRPEAWEIVRATPHLTYQILTKRPERIAAHLPEDWGDGWPNVWLGVSGETYLHALRRGEILAAIPARVRFLSAEPWLERRVADPFWYADLLGRFQWAILGGESGANCRPFDLDTARAFRDGAILAEIPLFLKQLGGHPDKRDRERAVLDGRTWTETPR